MLPKKLKESWDLNTADFEKKKVVNNPEIKEDSEGDVVNRKKNIQLKGEYIKYWFSIKKSPKYSNYDDGDIQNLIVI